jgi:probable F420-dependent oxidoreductase
VKFWQAVAFLETDQLLDVARAAEDAGIHGIMVSDHIVFPEDLTSPYPYSPDGKPMWAPSTPWPDPWVLIGAMAAVTDRLHFGTNIFIAPARPLFTVAKQVSTAAVLSDNRVVLGLAAGWMREEFELMGEDFTTRGRRLDEMVDALRRLWVGGMVDYHGTFYDFERLQISPVPDRPIPIYGGGDSEPALRRAARLCDGWIGNAYEPDEAFRQVDTVRRHLDAAGRADDNFDIVIAVLAPPDVELYRRLEDAGVTSMMCAPWMMADVAEGSYSSTLDAKRRAIDQFGRDVIAKMA